MKTNTMKSITVALALGLSVAMTNGLRADSFGSGANAFTIDFVTVGNPGNADDVDNPYGFNGPGDQGRPYGGLVYTYRMGVYEISQEMLTKASNLGMVGPGGGAWGPSQPATNIPWYQMAAFVNWLNTSTGHQAAYNVTWDGSAWNFIPWSSGDAWQLGGENLNRHKDAFYFLPTDDEWYKAAFHKNDGATGNYWDYATGSDTIPTAVANGTLAGTAVYNSVNTSPADVNSAGGLSAYGTMGQGGNVFEWTESGGISDKSYWGGSWASGASSLSSSGQSTWPANNPATDLGFRVASIPEPSGAALILSGLGALLLRRRGDRSA